MWDVDVCLACACVSRMLIVYLSRHINLSSAKFDVRAGGSLPAGGMLFLGGRTDVSGVGRLSALLATLLYHATQDSITRA